MQEEHGSLQVFCRPKLKVANTDTDNRIVVSEGITFININAATEWRANTLLTKEPVTIEWLNTFQKDDVFVDVGANVGVYTLYAALKRKVQTYAFEPESQNYAALNYNINLNHADKKIKAFCLALSDSCKLSKLMLTNMAPGASCHQFDRNESFSNKPAGFNFEQGSFSVTLDWLVDNKMILQPTHIKVDVDGIEHLVIKGAENTLTKVKSLIVEVNQNLAEHVEMIKFIEKKGFVYDPNQVQRSERKEGPFKGVAEIIFTRPTQIVGPDGTRFG